MRQAGVGDLAGPLEPGLFGDPLRGDVRRQDEGDDLLELELAGALTGSDRRLGSQALAMEAGLDAPGELDFGHAFDRGPSEAAATDEGAALPLDQDPGAEAVVLPVDLVALDQLVEHLGAEGRQRRGAQPALDLRPCEVRVVEGAVLRGRPSGEEPLGLLLPGRHPQGRSVRGNCGSWPPSSGTSSAVPSKS